MLKNRRIKRRKIYKHYIRLVEKNGNFFVKQEESIKLGKISISIKYSNIQQYLKKMLNLEEILDFISGYNKI